MIYTLHSVVDIAKEANKKAVIEADAVDKNYEIGLISIGERLEQLHHVGLERESTVMEAVHGYATGITTSTPDSEKGKLILNETERQRAIGALMYAHQW